VSKSATTPEAPFYPRERAARPQQTEYPWARPATALAGLAWLTLRHGLRWGRGPGPLRHFPLWPRLRLPSPESWWPAMPDTIQKAGRTVLLLGIELLAGL